MTSTSRLELTGLIASGPLQIGVADLDAMPGEAQIADVGQLMPGRQGRGVRLSALLARARPRREARYVHVTSADPAFAVSLGLEEVVLTGIVVYGSTEGPLDKSKGGPFRLLIPNHPDECVNVKGIIRLHVAANPGRDTRPKDDAEHAKLHAKHK